MRYRRLILGLLIAAPAIVGIALTGVPLVRHYFNERPSHVIDLRTLGRFDLNEQTGTEDDIPKLIRKLDGRRVSVDGMMWDLHSLHSWGPGVSQFQLVYNIQNRRWGPPLVQERIFVHGGRGIVWLDQLVRVRGTFHAHFRRDNTGAIREVFSITDPTVDAALPEPAEARTSDAWIWGLLVTAVLVLLTLRRRLQRMWDEASQRRMRRNAAFCRKCGYDLRASTVRCPECGTPFTAPWRFGADAPTAGATANPQPQAASVEAPFLPTRSPNP